MLTLLDCQLNLYCHRQLYLRRLSRSVSSGWRDVTQLCGGGCSTAVALLWSQLLGRLLSDVCQSPQHVTSYRSVSQSRLRHVHVNHNNKYAVFILESFDLYSHSNFIFRFLLLALRIFTPLSLKKIIPMTMFIMLLSWRVAIARDRVVAARLISMTSTVN